MTTTPNTGIPSTLREGGRKVDLPGYAAIHRWVYKNIVDPGFCQHCKTTTKKLSWANKSGNYLRELDDWMRLCYSCHVINDHRKEYCKHGHLLTGTNAHKSPDTRGNHIRCWECNRINARRYYRNNRDKLLALNTVKCRKYQMRRKAKKLMDTALKEKELK